MPDPSEMVMIRDSDALCKVCRWRGNHEPGCAAEMEPWPMIPRTDHGTAQDAIDFVLDQDDSQPMDFLRAWRESALWEWKEFYDWLDNKRLERANARRG